VRKALTDGKITRRYCFGSVVEADWRPGGHYRYTRSGVGVDLAGGWARILSGLKTFLETGDSLING